MGQRKSSKRERKQKNKHSLKYKQIASAPQLDDVPLDEYAHITAAQ